MAEAVVGGGPERVAAEAESAAVVARDVSHLSAAASRRGFSIDAVVVRRGDGTLGSTAFVVRFDPSANERLSRGLSSAYASLERGFSRLRGEARPSGTELGFSEEEEDDDDDDGGGEAADGGPRGGEGDPVRVRVNGRLVPCGLACDPEDGRCRFGAGDGTRPSGAELGDWGLVEGRNDVRFEVVAARSGKVQCAEARVYLWGRDDRVVVCDVDGTITASDVRGFIDSTFSDAPTFAHADVCEFFETVVAPRARVLYLTSRPVALAAATRGFLATLRQDGRGGGGATFGLPDGPLLTSAEGVVGAIYTEMVTKRPDVFKTRALRDVVAAFGGASQPLACGFGNRETDAKAYARAGVPNEANFLIDASSTLRLPRATLEGMQSHVFRGYADRDLTRRVAGALRPRGAPPLPRPLSRGQRVANRPNLSKFLASALDAPPSGAAAAPPPPPPKAADGDGIDIFVHDKAVPPPPPKSPPPPEGRRRSPPAPTR